MEHPETHGERERTRRPFGGTVGLWLGLVLFGTMLAFVDLKPGEPQVTRMAAVAVLMAVWWIADAIPLAATAMLPLVLFPLLGIMSGRETAPIYVNHIIFLFVGGFMIALAMQRWNLHRRMALWIIRIVGGGPSRLVLSFMLASAFLSMWISNTATAIMMLAIALAIIEEQEHAFGRDRSRNLSVALLLGVAYGASVGGLATLVGTPPNPLFVQIFEITFPQAREAGYTIGFGQWMLLGLPLSVIMLAIIWLMLTRVFYRVPAEQVLAREVIDDEYRRLGPMTFAEAAVLAVFTLTALLWVFRQDLVLGGITVPGWSRLLPASAGVEDGTVAVAMALLLFLIPSRSESEQAGPALLDIAVFTRIPWAIVLLFGGGFALASGFQTTGLSSFVGERFAGLQGASPLIMIVSVCFTMTFLTELTSNTATTEIVLPILGSVSGSIGVNPLVLMIPATLSASCAFMLPVATPPNAIIFGSGRIRIAEMARVGICINLIGVLVVTLVFATIGTTVLSIDFGVVPDWARTAHTVVE